MYTIRKFGGDDMYSWAVFRKMDLPKGHRGTVMFGQASPVVSGLSRSEAQYHKRQLDGWATQR